jgi:hypothetical protein
MDAIVQKRFENNSDENKITNMTEEENLYHPRGIIIISSDYKLTKSKLNKAKERSLKFKLNFKTFIMLTSQNCTYCGIEPKQVQKAAGGNYIYNGIDRKDPNIGYTTDNCTPCCKICNRAKLDMSFEDFQKYLLRIKSNGLMKKFFSIEARRCAQ